MRFAPSLKETEAENAELKAENVDFAKVLGDVVEVIASSVDEKMLRKIIKPEALLGTTASRALAIGDGGRAGACAAEGQGSGSRKRPREGGE